MSVLRPSQEGAQPPKSDVWKRTSFVVDYIIDGDLYREVRNLDVTEGKGNFLAPMGIKKFNKNAGLFGPLYTDVDPESDEGKKVLNSVIRNNSLTSFATNWAFKDEETTNAANESGYIHMARGAASFINEKGVPYKDRNTEKNIIEDNTTVNRNDPKRIFGADMFRINAHLKYPIDMFIGGEAKEKNKGSQDYIFIEQFLYKAPQPKIGDYAAVEGKKDEVEQERKTLLGTVLREGMSRSNNLGDPKGSCILPIPNRLGVSQGVNWGEGKANAVELGAFQAITSATKGLSGGNLVKLIQDGFEQGKSVFNTISQDKNNSDGGVNAGRVINAVIAKSVLGRIGINVDTEQFITRETGAAINPNLELLFGGPQLRTFSFVFNFAPNSIEEAVVVRKIQRWFREGMLPQKTTNFGNGGSLFLGSPNIFRICYKNDRRRIKGLNTFKICACTSVEIDFTPDGVYQSYEDENAKSMPVRSSMKVTFNELTPIFANDYTDMDDPSIEDLGLNVKEDDAFTEDDLGF